MVSASSVCPTDRWATIDGVPGQTNSDRGIAATIGVIGAASDEHKVRAGAHQARDTVVAALNARTPTLTLAAAWL